MGRDFNGYIGTKADGYDRTHVGFGNGVINSREVSILDFVTAYDLVIVNSLFKKKEDHLVTFRSGATKTQTDYFLIKVV